MCTWHVQHVHENLSFLGTWDYRITFSNWNIQIKMWMDKIGCDSVCCSHFLFSFSLTVLGISSVPSVFLSCSNWTDQLALCSHHRKPYIGNKCWNRSWQPFSDYLLSRKRLQILVGRYWQPSFPYLDWKNSDI